MYKNVRYLLPLFFSFALAFNLSASTPIKLWYKQPAQLWVEALPLGNGRIGAMVFGNPAHDEFQLNEETVWTGSPYNNVNYKARESLTEIRNLIFEGKNLEAQTMAGPQILSTHSNGMAYQTVGSLKLDFEGLDKYTHYHRELDIENAVSKVCFESNGVTYTRESFTSFPDQLLVIRLTASEKAKLSFQARYTSPYPNAQKSVDSGLLRLDGKGDDHEGIEGKIRFTALTKIENKGGKVEAISDSVIQVKNATAVTLYVSIGTNFINYRDITANQEQVAKNFLHASKQSYQKLKEKHIAFYRSKFRTVSFDLGENGQVQKPTDIRLKEFHQTFDPHLVSTYFQFGRYLLLCSSQPGGQPANLQGIWNEKRFAPWDGKYANDINVEMNYWPAELTNLADQHLPLIDLIKHTAEQGKESARMYGCRGWTVHHITDIWCATGAVDHPFYGIWPTANAWFCQHLWDRYLYSGDRQYLQDVYPVMKGACEFFFDFLVRHPRYNWFVAAPSYSPENSPILNGVRSKASVVAGATIDNQMLSDLFHNTAQAAALLSDSKSFVDSLNFYAQNLPPMQVGKWGQLQEWLDDWDDPTDQHRHLSHLWGVYPGRQINAFDTPILFNAAKKSLMNRGDHSTGWSMGWKVCLWARFLDGEMAHKLISEQLTPTLAQKGTHGGTYPNMFDAHPPFQIDGNFGCTAGIAEMLVQSHTNAIHLLPALPKAWEKGTVKGLRCRGGFTIDELIWKDNKIIKVVVKSNLGGILRLRTETRLCLDGNPLSVSTTLNENPFIAAQKVLKPLVDAKAPLVTPQLKSYYEYDIPTTAGEVYTLTCE